jgi:hypothetical protein
MRKPAFSVLPFLLLAACAGNRAPSRPELTGPEYGRPGDPLTYAVVSTDPEGEEVAYKLGWGDTSSIDWSRYYASGQPVTRVHTYADTGRYVIRATARDPHENESGLSDSLVVTISQLPPGKPITPVGPAFCTTGVTYSYKVVAVHPQDEELEFQFDWGGTVGDWGNSVGSGETASIDHVFDSAGTYAVAARARDDAGLISAWSDPLAVTVVDIPGGPPLNLSLRAETDTTVRLTWSPPVEGTPNLYRVMFKQVGGGAPVIACETADTTCEHDPSGMTGQYSVLALFGATPYEGADALSTIPIHSGTTTVGELSGPDKPGCGWPAPDRLAKTYDMGDTIWVDSIDFYVSDFKPGSDGPTYYLASPDLAPADSGGSVPAGRWQTTHLAVLADELSPLPPVGDSAWTSRVAVPDVPVHAAFHTQHHYFAMVKVTQLRIPQEDLRMQAWFQPVQGLRLLRH